MKILHQIPMQFFLQQKKIILMALYADSIYECRQQLVYQLFQWIHDPPIPQCMICDNCSQREKDMQIVKIVISLLQHISNSQINLHYIMREDVIDVFYGNKNNNVS
jgi:hypothetical protein